MSDVFFNPAGAMKRMVVRTQFCRASLLLAATLAASISTGCIGSAAENRSSGARYTAVEEAKVSREQLFSKTLPNLSVSAALLPNGNLAVLRTQERFFTVFDSMGALQGTLGEPGNVNDEFEQVFPGHIGDTLYRIDQRGRRLTKYLNGAQIGAPQAAPFVVVHASDTTRVIGVFPRGEVLSGFETGDIGPAQVWTAYLHTPGENAPTTVATLRNRNRIASIKFAGFEAVLTQTFVPEQFVIFSPPSGRVALVTQEDAPTGDSALVRVRWRDARGNSLVRQISFAGAPVQSQDVDSVVNNFAREFASGKRDTAVFSVAALRDSATRVLVRPRFAPVLRDAFMDDDGRAWLHVRASNDWLLVTRAFTAIDTVALPGDARPVAARGSTLWVQFADREHTPTLARYSLTSGPAKER